VSTDRELLAEQLADWTYRGRNMTRSEANSYAGYLLPVVDRLANQRAAAELRAAADYKAEAFPGEVAVPVDKLRDRADALDPRMTTELNNAREPYTPCAFGCCDCPTTLPCTPEPGSWLRDMLDAAEQRGYERALEPRR
jgi:hypothetical protein